MSEDLDYYVRYTLVLGPATEQGIPVSNRTAGPFTVDAALDYKLSIERSDSVSGATIDSQRKPMLYAKP